MGRGKRFRSQEAKGLIPIARGDYKPDTRPEPRRRQHTAPILSPNTKVAFKADVGVLRTSGTRPDSVPVPVGYRSAELARNLAV